MPLAKVTNAMRTQGISLDALYSTSLFACTGQA